MRQPRSLIAAGCLLASACATAPRTLTVRAAPGLYSPAMSSAVGLGLTPIFEPPSGKTVDYHWSADFGYFVSWKEPDYTVVPLGPRYVANAGTMYWTYDPKLTSVRKRVVTIAIDVVDAATGRVMAAAKVKLDWDRDTARVRE